MKAKSKTKTPRKTTQTGTKKKAKTAAPKKTAKKSTKTAAKKKTAKSSTSKGKSKNSTKKKVLVPEVLPVEKENEELESLDTDKILADERAGKLGGKIAPRPKKNETLPVHMDMLQRYLMEVRRYSLMTREEEREVATKYYETGDSDAAQQMVTSNLRLVVKIALDYRKYWMNLLDLVQEGNLGLIQAVKNFNPYKEVKLSSYASFWIKAYILKYILDGWSMVKIGTTQAQRKVFFNLRKEQERYALLGYKPSAKEIAENLNVKEEVVVEMDQRMSGGDFSLDAPVGEEGEGTHLDFVESEDQPFDDMLAEVEIRRLFRDKLADFREQLDERELFILEFRLLADQPETLKSIGERFEVSRERVRQIEERIIKKLKVFFMDQVPDLGDVTLDITPRDID